MVGSSPIQVKIIYSALEQTIFKERKKERFITKKYVCVNSEDKSHIISWEIQKGTIAIDIVQW